MPTTVLHSKLGRRVLFAALLIIFAGTPAGAQPFVPNEVIVRFAPEAGPPDVDAALAAVGGRVLGDLGTPTVRGRGRLLHLRVPGAVSQAVAALRARAAVRYAEPNYVVHAFARPDDPGYWRQWGLANSGQTGGTSGADISAEAAWDAATGGSVVVAVIDSGIDPGHEDLAANLWVNPGEIAANGLDDDGNGFVDDVNGWDFYADDNDPTDDNGHGTHVAGTIGAVGDNAVGVTGVAWRVRIMPLKFLGGRNGSGSTAGAIRAVNYAASFGVRVTNNSWGGGGYSQALYDAIRDAGALFVAAAGNDGSDNDATASYPSGYALPNVVSVAATDDDDGLAGFSNFGRTSVDLGAPGVSIYSTLPGYDVPLTRRPYSKQPYYDVLSGTSMAAPHVAGVAALCLSRAPGLSTAALRAAILESVDPIGALSAKTVTGGRLNAAAALAALNAAPTVAIDAPVDGTAVANGTTVTLSGNASDPEDGPLDISALRWSSSVDGDLGSGSPLSVTLSADAEHLVTLTATDSGGKSAADSVVLVVGTPAANAPPVATISAPQDGAAFSDTETVVFTGGADDPEDGPLGDSALTWSSNIDGLLGSGGFVSTTLSVGSHQVTLTAVDSQGSRGTAVVTVEVTAARDWVTLTRGSYNAKRDLLKVEAVTSVPAAAAVMRLDVEGTGGETLSAPMTWSTKKLVWEFSGPLGFRPARLTVTEETTGASDTGVF